MRTHAKASLVFISLILFFTAGPSEASRWVPLGPFGGSVAHITVDPTNARVVYATLGPQGAFKSTDGGGSWFQIFAGETFSGVAVSPTDRRTLYLASPWLLRSTDGGAHWAEIRSVGYDNVLAIAFDPVIPSRIYLGTLGNGVMRSTDGGATWNPLPDALPIGNARFIREVIAARPHGRVFALTNGGLFRSVNGGLSWTAAAGLPAGVPQALAVDPADSRRVYVGLAGLGIFRSTDGGVSWEPTPAQPPGSGTVRSLAVSAQGVWAGMAPGGLFRSADGGATWTAAGPPRSILAVATPPSSPRTVYLGTQAEGSFLGGVFASTNGGATWARRNQGLASLPIQDLEVIHGLPGWLWVSIPDLGVFQSEDGGKSWHRTSLRLPPGSKVDLVSSLADPLLLYAYARPRLWRTLDGGLSWSERTQEPLLLRVWADGNDPSNLWGSRGADLLLSPDAGTTWTRVQIPLDRWDGIYSMAFAPSAPSIVYAGGSRCLVPLCQRYPLGAVLRSRDGGATWTAVMGMSGFPTLIVVDPADPDQLYVVAGPVFYNSLSHRLSRSTDGGDTWTSIDPGGLPWPIEALAVPSPGVVWVVQDVYPEPRIFRSGDAGQTWRDRTKNLHAEVYQLAGDPANPRRIYATTTNGVWVLEDDE